MNTKFVASFTATPSLRVSLPRVTQSWVQRRRRRRRRRRRVGRRRRRKVYSKLTQ